MPLGFKRCGQIKVFAIFAVLSDAVAGVKNSNAHGRVQNLQDEYPNSAFEERNINTFSSFEAVYGMKSIAKATRMM